MEKVSTGLQENIDAIMTRTGLVHVISYEVLDDIQLNPKRSFYNIEITKEKYIEAVATAMNVALPQVIIYVNERYLNELYNISEEHYIIALEKMLATISYNYESGKISKKAPDVCEHSLILKRFSYEKCVEEFGAASAQAQEKYLQLIDTLQNGETISDDDED